MKKGRLIVLEGLDGCGKSTQFELLCQNLQGHGIPAIPISFPDYKEPSSALVREYLAGAYGKAADDVNAFAASSFYACDRYASYRKYWMTDYQSGGVIVAARYTTSNPTYQMVKLPQSEWPAFLDWLEDYEYEKLGLPRPDQTFFLDMPLSVSRRLLASRYQGDLSRKDLHERDDSYMERCRNAALYTAQRWGFHIVPCAKDEEPYPIEEIAARLFQLVLPCIQEGQA